MNNLPPGRELDALIAEKVMGWSRREPIIWPDGSKTTTGWRDHENSTFYPDRDGEITLPYFSSDIDAAWRVVEHIRKTTHLDVFSMSSPSDETDKWWACFDKKWFGHDLRRTTIFDWESGETPAHAICMAALKTLQ